MAPCTRAISATPEEKLGRVPFFSARAPLLIVQTFPEPSINDPPEPAVTVAVGTIGIGLLPPTQEVPVQRYHWPTEFSIQTTPEISAISTTLLENCALGGTPFL